MYYYCNSEYSNQQNAERCPRFINPQANACSTRVVTSSCAPWKPSNWVEPNISDPALYNWLNGCQLCNFDKMENENQYICNRAFYNGEVRAPCNRPNFFMPPLDSKDVIKAQYNKRLQ